MKKTRFIASFAVLAFSGLATAATTVVTDANIADYTGAANPNDSHFTGTGVLHVRRASLAEGFNLILR